MIRANKTSIFSTKNDVIIVVKKKIMMNVNNFVLFFIEVIAVDGFMIKEIKSITNYLIQVPKFH